MEELFRDFWWLIFPIAGLVAWGWSGLMAERRRRDALELVKTYAAKGQEPPAEIARMAYGKED